MHFKTRAFQRLIQVSFVIALMAGTTALCAQSVSRGNQLYNTHCAVCHTSAPENTIAAAASNAPQVLLNATINVPDMRFLRTILTATDRQDIAAYIGSRVGGPPPAAVTPQTGWYWNPNESGRGFFVEATANFIFMATFHYASNGRSDWFSSQGNYASNIFSAPMLTFAGGQTLSGIYRAPQATPSLGTLSLGFVDPQNLVMTWPPGNLNISRFAFSAGATSVVAPQAGSPENGWWWYDQEGGRGFALEVQGSTLFFCGFMYDAAGNPVWFLTTGAMSSATTYSGQWLEFANGQAMGAAWRAATLSNPTAGSVSINFTTTRSGNMTLPDGRIIPITRLPL